jgi:hypothetical protein
VAGLSAVVLVVLAAVTGTWLLADDEYVAQPPASAPATVQPGQAVRALAALQVALAAGDAEAAAAVAAPGDESARELLADLAGNAAALAVTDLSFRFVEAVTPLMPDGTWTATVDSRWRFGGFDPGPARADLAVTFRVEEDGVGVARFGPGVASEAGAGSADGRLPVWLAGPVQVRRSKDTLVLVAQDPGGQEAGGAARFAELARAAVDQVREVLPRWDTGLVVEVPATPERLRQALAAPVGTYDEVAAVTTAVDGILAPGAPTHVFVNPVVFGGLAAQGAQVVMTHEAAHVATDAPAADVPLWLLEGFADYVALREVALPIGTTAAQVIAQVRDEGVPQQLPGPSEFDTGATHLGATYEAAWVACLVLADVGGEGRLVDLYRAVSAGADLDTALRRRYGFGIAGLTRRWQDRLSGLAA